MSENTAKSMPCIEARISRLNSDTDSNVKAFATIIIDNAFVITGVKIKDLQAAAKHQLEVAAPINAVIRDTVFIRDTVPVVQQKVEMLSPHIQLDAVIDKDSLKGDIRLPVTLQQTVWVEYKRKCLFWKKVKAIHQTISSDNPYVDIKYSEYIQIDKK